MIGRALLRPVQEGLGWFEFKLTLVHCALFINLWIRKKQEDLVFRDNFDELNKYVGLDLMIYFDPEIQQTKFLTSELGTFEWWILGLMLDPLFFIISRLNNAFSLLVINLQIS